MTKLVILITAQVEKGVEVAEAWEQAGATGVTLIDSYGLHNLRERSKSMELQMFVSMFNVMRQIEQTNVTLLTVIDDDLVDSLIEAAGEVLGEIAKSHTGVAFVLDVDRVIGIPNFPKE
jgi:nitrogen regulatory protein PII